jgi:hypothetical protein
MESGPEEPLKRLMRTGGRRSLAVARLRRVLVGSTTKRRLYASVARMQLMTKKRGGLDHFSACECVVFYIILSRPCC